MSILEFTRLVDKATDSMLLRLNCRDGTDAWIASHWQAGIRPRYRIQITRKADNNTLTRFIGVDGTTGP